MSDLLSALYPWIKSLHIMAVISWMAGMFYLPRLFVYHAERADIGGEPVASFVIMEEKLMRVIMNPAMIVTWIAGVLLVLTPGVVDWSSIWPWTKLFGVLGMSWFHGWCSKERKALAKHGATCPGRHYRLMNEVPTVLMVIIVLSVVVRF